MKNGRPYRPNKTSIKIGEEIKWMKKNTRISTNKDIENYLKKNYKINISEKTICGWTNRFFTIGKKFLPAIEHMIKKIKKENENKNEKQKNIQEKLESISIKF